MAMVSYIPFITGPMLVRDKINDTSKQVENVESNTTVKNRRIDIKTLKNAHFILIHSSDSIETMPTANILHFMCNTINNKIRIVRHENGLFTFPPFPN